MKTILRSTAAVVGSALLLALAGCGGSGADAVAAPAPSEPPAPPAPTTTTLTLRGQVVDQPIANARVTVSVGGQTFMSTANVDGMYEVTVTMPVDAMDSFVSLNALGTGSQAAAELTSLLGSASTLMAQSGDDGVLDRSENSATNVTNLTTAEAVLVQQANAGAIPANDADLARARTSVDPVQVLNIAAAIKLVVDGGVALPPGIDTTLALAADPAAVGAFIVDQQTNNAAAFEAALNDTISNPAIVLSPTTSSVPEFAYAIVSATTVPQTLFGGAANGSLAFQYGAGGTGAFWTSNGFSADMRWSLVGTEIVSTFTTNPVVNFTNFPTDPATGMQVRIECTSETTEVRVRPLTGSSANVTQTGTTVCDDARFNESGSQTQTLLFAQTSQLETLTAADVAGNTLALTIYEPSFDTGLPGVEPMASDIVTFNADGTGTSRLRGRTLTWSAVDGSIQVVYSNGVTARYTLVRSFLNNGGLLLADFQRADGERRVAGSITWEVNPAEPAPTFAEFPGVYYQYGVGTQSTEGSDPRLKGFALEFAANGTIANRTDFVNSNGERQTNTGFFRTWGITPESAVRIEQHFDLNLGTSNPVTCPQGATTANCLLLDRRDIFIVNRSTDGRVVYVLERRTFDFANGVRATTPTTFFTRFYEEAANGDYDLPRTGVPAEPVRAPVTSDYVLKPHPASY